MDSLITLQVNKVAKRQRVTSDLSNRQADMSTPGSAYYSVPGAENKGGGADGQHAPSPTDIGIIIAVVVLVAFGISGLFYMRARKKRNVMNKDAEATTGGSPVTAREHARFCAGQKTGCERASTSSDGILASPFRDPVDDRDYTPGCGYQPRIDKDNHKE